MNDSISRSHELEISRVNRALVAGKVLVINCAVKKVRDGLLAAVGADIVSFNSPNL